MAKKPPPLDKGDKQSNSSRLQTQTVKKRSLQSNADLIAEFDALHARVAELQTARARAIEAERVVREQAETLRAASLALTESLDLERIFEKLLDYLALLVPYDSATIFLMEEGAQLVARAVRGYERFTDLSLDRIVRIERNSIPRIDHLVDEQISHIISDTTQDSTWIWVPATMHIRNWLAVPLVANGRTIGLYSLDKTEPNFFTDEHRHLAEALAAQAALAIEKSQLFDREAATRARTETQSRRLNALNLVAQAVSSTRDLNEILEIAAREITTQLNARSCGVALINSTRTHLEVVAFAGQEGESSTVGIVIPLEGNLGTQQVISTRRPLVIADAQTSPLQNEGTREIFKERGATCILITPLIARDEVIGTFGTDTSDTHRVFTAEEVELAVTIASQISSAIENARLFDETQRRTQEIATMAEIGREISATLDLSTVLERIALRAIDVLRARDVVLRLLEPDGRLPAAVAIGKYADIYKNWDAQLGRGLSGSVAQSGVAEIINDPENDPRVVDIAGTEQDKASRAILFAPLMIGETVIGVLSVWRDKIDAGAFTQADLDFTVSLARQAAIAIQNARLFTESQQRFKETEILRAANVALTKSFDLDSILRTLLDYLQQIVPYDTGSVFLLESETHLTARAAHGYEQWIENPAQAIGISFEFKTLPHIRAVVEDQATVIIPDVTQDPHWIETPTGKHVRNWLAVPLVAGGKTIGMYSLDKAEPGFFTPEHHQLAENLATQAAIAIQNATLFQNQRVAREQAETLQAITQALSRTLSLQEVFDLILTELEKVVPYDSCSVQQLDDDGFVIVGGRGFPNLEELIGLRFPNTAGDLNSYVISTRQPYIVDDIVVRFPHFKNREHGAGRIHGWLGVPLIFGNRLIGMLALDKHEKSFYTPEHAHLAMAFAAQAAVAIENARLFETEHIAREQAEVQTRQMAALNRVAQAVTSTLDLQAVLEIAAREMTILINARSAGVGLLNESKTELRVTAYYSQADEPSAVGLIIPVEGNLATQQVIETGQSVLIPDAQNTPLQNEATRAVMRARNTHCILILPLLARGEVIGTIGPDTDQPDRVFTPEEVQLAQTITNQLAGIIENARLFDAEREAHQQAETLRSIANALNSSISPSEVFDVVLTEIQNVIPYDSAAIFQVQNNRRTFAAGHGFTNLDELKNLSFEFTPEGDKIGYRVLHLLSPLILDDALDSYPEYFNVEPHAEGKIRSYMGIPVLLGNEMIGMITLDKKEAGYYTSHHANLAMAFAAQAATAINNARLFDETQRLLKETEQRNAELAILNDFGKAMTRTLDVKVLTRDVGDIVREIFRAEIANILLYDPKSNQVHLAYSYMNGYFDDELPWDLGEGGLTSKIILSRQPLLLNSAKEMQEHGAVGYITAPKDEPDTQSYLGVPIMVGERVLGVVDVQSIRPNAFDENNQRLLQTLSSNMGVAFENARLFDETQRLLKETEQRAAELQIINNIGQTLTEELDLNTMIEHVGDKLREAFKVGNIRIAVVDEKTGLLVSPYVYRHDKRVAFEENWQEKSARYKLAMRASARKGFRSWVVNTNAEKSWRKFAIVTDEEDIPKSFVMLPLLAGKEVIGGINIPDYEKENAFTDLSVGMLETIASNMGTAIQNARLFDETKRLFQEAQEARAAAEQANKAKSTFLANMSHELRTPLNSIMGFTSLVREKSEGVLPEKQLGNLDKVLSSSQHLLGLINTVLDLAKIEAGRVDVIPAKFNISSLADQCANLAAPLLKPNVTLEKQVDDTIGIIFSDQDKIKQIVLNLLSNAAKFTHEGRILLSVQNLNDEMLKISVTDSGIGISEEALGLIFEEFQQADTSTTRQYGGTGLGLAISRNLARLLGGDLVAASQLGQGSTFTLTLPIYYGRKPDSQSNQETAAVQGSAQPSKNGVTKHRVLVIDDDPDAIYLLQEGLGTSEFEVIGARNGHDGLRIARDQQPEAILLDVLMPETDGWQILNDLKSEPATVNIPVILLTIVDKKALGFKLGAVDYMLKPLNPIVVLDALRRVVGEKSGACKCVIVVDDDPNVAEMLRQILSESEFELNSAEDGEAGFQAIKAHRPDVILLDLMMPKLDGFGVIARLRADPEIRNIPIIVISAKELTSEESKALKESVAFVMKKQGFDGGKLVEEINSVVKK